MMRSKDDYRSMSGLQKAALLVMSVGEETAAKLFQLMHDDEIREISQTMANLGTVNATVIERLFVEFADQISSTGTMATAPGCTTVCRSNVWPSGPRQRSCRISNTRPRSTVFFFSN